MAVSDHLQGYQCEFIDSVPDDFYCKGCTLVARRLVFTSCCGESYCHACIDDTQQLARPCPACGKQDFNIFEQVKYQGRIKGFQVHCSMKGRGCGWSGLLEQLNAHLDPDQDNCQHVDTKCPLNCQQSIPRNKVEQHVAKECVKRDYICQYCAFKATYEEVVDTHLPQCIYVPLQCPNLCGVTCEREIMEDHMKMCRLEEVACEFSGVGCDGRFVREDKEEHTRQNSHKHLALTCAATIKMNRQLQQKLQQQEQNVIKQEQKSTEQEQKLEHYKQQLQEQEEKFANLFQEQDQKFQKLLQELDKKVTELQEKSYLTEVMATEINNFVTCKRIFVMENFSQEKAKNKPNDWKSPAMYTHVCGYKFCIGIDANGNGDIRGKAVEVKFQPMKGEYDNQLKWPATCRLTIEVTNPKGKNSRDMYSITWEKPKDKSSLKTYCFQREQCQLKNAFVLHTHINDFLHNDTLHFTITFDSTR